MSADTKPVPEFAPSGAAGYEPHRWAAVGRELVRLRREETASDMAAEAATVDELHRALQDRQSRAVLTLGFAGSTSGDFSR